MIVAFSPHADDLIFSAGEYITRLKDVQPVTVFAGLPANKEVLTAYDVKSGFGTSYEAAENRQKEDIAAFAALKMTPTYLDFVDGQYGENRERDAVRVAMRPYFEEAETVIAPMGVLHPDHVYVSDTIMELGKEFPDKPIILYEDTPYRVVQPDAIWEKRQHWQKEGFTLFFDGQSDYDPHKKIGALMAYRSQLGGDLNIYNLCSNERLWRVSR